MAINTLFIDPVDILYKYTEPDVNLHTYLEMLGITPRHPRVVQKALKAAYYDVLHGRIDRDLFYDALLRFHGVDETGLAAGREALLADEASIRAQPGATSAIRILRQFNLRMVIIINSPHSSQDIVDLLAKVGFAPDIWTAVIASRDVGHAIPEPDIFETAVNIANAVSSETAFISTDISVLPLLKDQGYITIAFGPTESAVQAHYHLHSFEALVNLLTS